MKKIKMIFSKIAKHKKIVGIIAALLLVIIIVIIVFFGVTKKEEQSQVLSNSLKDLGIDFYENFYYNQIGKDDKERKEFLEKYKDIGIKVNLDSLSRYKKDETDEILKKFVNSETEEECDKDSSMVVIYPKDPYGKKDYSIDANLVCGFEETKTNKE